MKNRKYLMIAVVAFSTLLSSFAFYAYQVVYVANFNVEKDDSYFYIPTGAGFKDVQQRLKKQEVVGNLMAFSLCCTSLNPAPVGMYNRG